MESSYAQVKIGDHWSDPFDINNGVGQGDSAIDYPFYHPSPLCHGTCRLKRNNLHQVKTKLYL